MPTGSSEVLRRLRSGKDSLRQARRNAPLSEKLRQLVHAQHLYVQLARGRRPLKPWQRPWNILSDVSESVVITSDRIEPTTTRAVASTRSYWIQLTPQLF